MKSIIFWQSPHTKNFGFGKPIDSDSAAAWVEILKQEVPEFHHKAIPVDVFREAQANKNLRPFLKWPIDNEQVGQYLNNQQLINFKMVKNPKPEMVIVTIAHIVNEVTAFGTTCERQQPLRSGAIRQLVRQGVNTPWAWVTKEHECIDPYATDLEAMRKATKSEVQQYYALLSVVG